MLRKGAYIFTSSHKIYPGSAGADTLSLKKKPQATTEDKNSD